EFRAAIVPAIPDIVALLKDSDNHVRSITAHTLARFSEQAEFRPTIADAIPGIVALLTDSDDLIRSTGALAVVMFSDQDSAHSVRSSTVSALAKFSEQGAGRISSRHCPAIPDIVALLKDSDEVVRSRGVSELAKFSEQGAVGDNGIRIQLTFYHSRISTRHCPAIPDIVALLKDPHRFVRSSGVLALAKVSEQAELRPAIACLIPAIVALLEDAHFQTQTNVLDLLVQLAAHDCLREAILGCKLERHFISLVNNDEDEVVSNVGKLFVAFAERGKL
ncbi:armadillo-type protein, partial [Hysterangium stoloniferum]